MDSDRFDSLARSLADPTSRRRAMLATLGGALGLLGVMDPDDALAKGECAPACSECATCQKGTCKKKKRGKKCKPGKCLPKTAGTACGNNSCQECQGGACVNKASNATCTSSGGANGLCLNGACNLPPPCRPIGSTGCTLGATTECCGSGVCTQVAPGATVCLTPGGAGTQCLIAADCISGTCAGFRCQ